MKLIEFERNIIQLKDDQEKLLLNSKDDFKIIIEKNKLIEILSKKLEKTQNMIEKDKDFIKNSENNINSQIFENLNIKISSVEEVQIAPIIYQSSFQSESQILNCNLENEEEKNIEILNKATEHEIEQMNETILEKEKQFDSINEGQNNLQQVK